jgi:hypothetical protein
VSERWPDINPTRLVIVEHYDDRQTIEHLAARYGRYHAERALLGRKNGECFDLVTFGAGLEAVRQRARSIIPTAVEPQWKHVTKAEVKQLIGGELP